MSVVDKCEAQSAGRDERHRSHGLVVIFSVVTIPVAVSISQRVPLIATVIRGSSYQDAICFPLYD